MAHTLEANLTLDVTMRASGGPHCDPAQAAQRGLHRLNPVVDWSNTEGSPYVDIPMECIDLDNYRASLAHKANHSFSPNCKFVSVDHPRYTILQQIRHQICIFYIMIFCFKKNYRFGRIPALKTLVPIPRYAELFSHYKVCK